MRRPLAMVLTCVLAGAPLGAQSADVSYVEGEADLRRSDGKVTTAEIGDVLRTGDGLRTGRDGTVELDQSGAVIRVSPGTVFTLMEKTVAGEPAPVLSVALGSIRMRYDRITGKEPLIRTNSISAGVRGTELTVWSGADGSTLIAVEAGLVTVESEGVSVDLAANEAVEVPLGSPPGPKITLQRDQIDYSTWNQQKLESLLADPVAGIRGVRQRLEGYVAALGESDALYRGVRAQLETERAARAKIADEKGKDEADKYEAEVVQPLLLQTTAHRLNVRYNALAALSLRRYVAGRLYVMLKPRQLAGGQDAALAEFLGVYRDVLELFEKSVTPFLVDADI